MKKEKIEILIKECRIHPATNYPMPKYTMGLSVGSAFYRFGGEGDLSVVTGKAKSRKTFLMGVLAASALTYNSNGDKVPNGTNKVLYFDTEQSNYHAAKSLRRILAIAGNNYSEDIQYYALRGLSVLERLSFIENVLKITKGVKAVFIDGARDLVSSINDEHQATNIIDLFSRWTRTGRFHLVTVLHENSATEKLRGHLGTELTNKAESVFAVEIVKKAKSNTSRVYTRYSRNGDMIEFEFVVDQAEVPHIECSVKIDANQESPEVVRCLKECFQDKPQMGHTELINKFQEVLKNNGIGKGINVLKEWLISFLEQGVLFKEGKDRSPRAYYYLKS